MQTLTSGSDTAIPKRNSCAARICSGQLYNRFIAASHGLGEEECSRSGELLWGSSSDPASQFARDELFNQRHARLAIIEAWNNGKIFAPCRVENFAAFDGDLIERFETIGRKARSDD